MGNSGLLSPSCLDSLLGSYNKHRFSSPQPSVSRSALLLLAKQTQDWFGNSAISPAFKGAEEVWADGTDWSLQQPLIGLLHPPRAMGLLLKHTCRVTPLSCSLPICFYSPEAGNLGSWCCNAIFSWVLAIPLLALTGLITAWGKKPSQSGTTTVKPWSPIQNEFHFPPTSNLFKKVRVNVLAASHPVEHLHLLACFSPGVVPQLLRSLRIWIHHTAYQPPLCLPVFSSRTAPPICLPRLLYSLFPEANCFALLCLLVPSQG